VTATFRAQVDSHYEGSGNGDEVGGRDLLRYALLGVVRASYTNREADARVWFKVHNLERPLHH
jgi:hypothetical protein